MIFGIQGGPASFNDLALKDYVSRHLIENFEIAYLFTTEKVLQAIDDRTVDFGQFAIHNSAGGMVTETLDAISKHQFTIIEEFAITIRHNLMKLPEVDTKDIQAVMAHDQVLKQCKRHLSEKYNYLVQKVGEGDLIDTATAAKALKEGKLDKNTFILGNPMIAGLYGLETVDTNLQDLENNLTTFLMVKKRS
jgi:prephenate dehydratase